MTKPINSSANDFTNAAGVRVSLPCYVDLTNTQRKELLNGVREAISATTTSSPKSISGITVETVSRASSDIEAHIGMNIDILRGVLFQRGGLEVSLVLRLQEVTGLTFVSDKDFTAAFKARHDLIKKYTKSLTPA
jgi:hypothetical protein